MEDTTKTRIKLSEDNKYTIIKTNDKLIIKSLNNDTLFEDVWGSHAGKS